MASEKTVTQKEGGTAFAWFHATSVNGGAMLIAAVIASYFSVYMTDTLGIPAAVASMIMFVATLWDAINDPMMGVISVGALLSMVVLMPIFLKVFKTGQKALLVSQVSSIVLYVILFFFGKTNFIFLCVLTFISVCTASMQNALVNVLVNDTIDFIQYKEGKSANGVISSIKGFAQKCGNTVVSSGILAVLSVSGYIAGAIGQQPESAMFALNFLKFGAPSLTGIILIICVVKNPMQKYAKEIEEMKRKMGE